MESNQVYTGSFAHLITNVEIRTSKDVSDKTLSLCLHHTCLDYPFQSRLQCPLAHRFAPHLR